MSTSGPRAENGSASSGSSNTVGAAPNVVRADAECGGCCWYLLFAPLFATGAVEKKYEKRGDVEMGDVEGLRVGCMLTEDGGVMGEVEGESTEEVDMERWREW